MPHLAPDDARGSGGQRDQHRRFLGFHVLAGHQQHRPLLMQPAPLESHEVTPAQAGVEAHQDEIAQPGGCRNDEPRFLLIGEPAQPLLALLIQRDAAKGRRGHPVPPHGSRVGGFEDPEFLAHAWPTSRPLIAPTDNLRASCC